MQVVWLALGFAAALLDSESVAAAQWLALCSTLSASSLLHATLRIDQHMLAFPMSMVVMTGHCLVWIRDEADACSLQPWQTCAGMLVSMPIACGLAALFASVAPFAMQPLAYALTMLLVPLLCMKLLGILRKQAHHNGRKLVVNPR
jgi:hypothetical protein